MILLFYLILYTMIKNVGLRVYEKFSPQYFLYEEMHKHQTLQKGIIQYNKQKWKLD